MMQGRFQNRTNQPESKQLYNIDATHQTMTWSGTLRLHPVHSSTHFRSEEPADIETTSQHWGSTLQYSANFKHCFYVHSVHSKPGFKTETTSQNRNNQPELRQHTASWCKSGTLLSHSTQRKASEPKQTTRIETNSQHCHTTPEFKVEHWVAAFCLLLVRSRCFCILHTQQNRFLYRNNYYIMMRMSNTAFWFITQQDYRTETTIQNRNSQRWCSTPRHGVNVEFGFCNQHSKTGFRTEQKTRIEIISQH